ncbi:MAG: hypothetical protein ACJ74G_06305 [Blastocatellia bacterium]
MKKRIVHYRFLLCAVVLCGLLASLTFTGSETHAFNAEGIGKITNTVPGAMADATQEPGERQTVSPGAVQPLAPTLGCCKCLGGTTGLDLSTASFNNWIVKDTTTNSAWATAAFVTLINPAWNLNTGPSKWVSTVANGGMGSVAGHIFEYQLAFTVSACVIEQRVTLTGNCGGDDEIWVYLDNTTSANLLSQCTGGWCFNTSNPPPAFNRLVGAGSHTLIVKVKNGSPSPSGMFVNAKLTGNCRN